MDLAKDLGEACIVEGPGLDLLLELAVPGAIARLAWRSRQCPFEVADRSKAVTQRL